MSKLGTQNLDGDHVPIGNLLFLSFSTLRSLSLMESITLTPRRSSGGSFDGKYSTPEVSIPGRAATDSPRTERNAPGAALATGSRTSLPTPTWPRDPVRSGTIERRFDTTSSVDLADAEGMEADEAPAPRQPSIGLAAFASPIDPQAEVSLNLAEGTEAGIPFLTRRGMLDAAAARAARDAAPRDPDSKVRSTPAAGAKGWVNVHLEAESDDPAIGAYDLDAEVEYADAAETASTRAHDLTAANREFFALSGYQAGLAARYTIPKDSPSQPLLQQLESWGVLDGNGLDRVRGANYSWLWKPLEVALRERGHTWAIEAAVAIEAFKRAPGPAAAGKVLPLVENVRVRFDTQVRINRQRLFGAEPTGGWRAAFTEVEQASIQPLRAEVAVFMAGFFQGFSYVPKTQRPR